MNTLQKAKKFNTNFYVVLKHNGCFIKCVTGFLAFKLSLQKTIATCGVGDLCTDFQILKEINSFTEK